MLNCKIRAPTTRQPQLAGQAGGDRRRGCCPRAIQKHSATIALNCICQWAHWRVRTGFSANICFRTLIPPGLASIPCMRLEVCPRQLPSCSPGETNDVSAYLWLIPPGYASSAGNWLEDLILRAPLCLSTSANNASKSLNRKTIRLTSCSDKYSLLIRDRQLSEN